MAHAWLMRGSCVRAWLMRGSCVAHARLMRACVAHAWLMRGSCVAHACVRGSCVARAWLMRGSCVAHTCVRGSCVAHARLMRACSFVLIRACVLIYLYMKPQLSFISRLNVYRNTMNSFKCDKCSYNTIRNYDLTRHLKKVHGIYGNTSFKGDNQLQAGIPSRMTEERQCRRESHRHRDMTDEEEEEEPRINPEDGLYPPEQIEEFDNDMRRKKCHILDCVLDTFPEHLKTKAKSMCDILKCKNRFSILPTHEIVIDGEIDRGSNIRDYIMDSLIEPPVPGTPKFTMLEKENEKLKRNLAYYEKALARARGLSRCRQFESIIDGSMDRCDFSDDTDSDESDGDDDDTDGTEDNDEDDDEEEDEEDDTDEDEEEMEEDEPSRKRKN